MITNEKQYSVTRNKLLKLQASLEKTKQDTQLPEVLQTAMDAGVQAQINDLQLEMAEYEGLKSSTNLVIDKLEELPQALVKIRIMRGLTQKELAKKLGVKEQQVQRDEAEAYSRAKIDRLIRIGEVLGIEMKGTFSLA